MEKIKYIPVTFTLIIILIFLIQIPSVMAASPDLTVISITFDPASVIAGHDTKIIVTYKNIGDAATPKVNFQNKIYLDGTLISTNYVNQIILNPGETKTHSITKQFTQGTHAVKAIVDYTNAISESNEGNNEATQSVSVSPGSSRFDVQPLDIKFAPYPPTAGQSTTITIDWINNGPDSIDIELNHWTSKVYIDGNEIYWWSLGGEGLLPPNTVYSQSFSYTFPSSGTKQAKVITDVNNNLAETNEGNNQYIEYVNVQGTPQFADLYINNLDFTHKNIRTGEPFSYTVTIQNLGDTDANNVRILNSLYSFGSYNELLYQYKHISIPAKGSQTLFVDFGNIAGGNKKLIIVADDNNLITESNENNNEFSKEFYVEEKIDYRGKKIKDRYNFRLYREYNKPFGTKTFAISSETEFLEVHTISYFVNEICTIASDFAESFILTDPNGITYAVSDMQLSEIKKEKVIKNPTPGIWTISPVEVNGKNQPYRMDLAVRTYVKAVEPSLVATVPIDEAIPVAYISTMGCEPNSWSGEASIWVPPTLDWREVGTQHIKVDTTAYQDINQLATFSSVRTEIYLEGQDNGPIIDQNPSGQKIGKDGGIVGFAIGSTYKGLFETALSLISKEIALGYKLIIEPIYGYLMHTPKEGSSHDNNVGELEIKRDIFESTAAPLYRFIFPLDAGTKSGIYSTSIIIKIKPITLAGNDLSNKLLIGVEYPMNVIGSPLNVNKSILSDTANKMTTETTKTQTKYRFPVVRPPSK